jgi:hypothetical protein
MLQLFLLCRRRSVGSFDFWHICNNLVHFRADMDLESEPSMAVYIGIYRLNIRNITVITQTFSSFQHDLSPCLCLALVFQLKLIGNFKTTLGRSLMILGSFYLFIFCRLEFEFNLLSSVWTCFIYKTWFISCSSCVDSIFPPTLLLWVTPLPQSSTLIQILSVSQ